MKIDRELGGAANHLAEIVWAIETSGLVSFTNNAWATLTGLQPSAACDGVFPQEFPPVDILHPDDRDKLITLWSQHQNDPKPFALEARFFDTNKYCYSWYRLSISPILDLDGTIRYWQAIANDIDHLKSMQTMLQLVMDNIPMSIFWKDKNSVYLGCNRFFTSHVGVSKPEELIGKTDYDNPSTKAQSDFFVDCDRRVMESGVPQYHIIEPQLRPDGRKAWLETNKIPLRDAGGKVIGVLGMYEDITKRVALETQREEFVATLIHDLKNPVIGANRVLDVLIAAKDKDVGTDKTELLRKIKESNLSLLQLIQNMLEVYKYHTSESTKSSETFAPKDIIERCLSEIETAAKIKKIELSLENTCTCKSIAGCKEEITRVFQNLLENAIKFTPENGHINVALSCGQNECLVEVKDDGVGMGAEDQNKLFSRFWQGEVGKNICNSSGLGLYICRKIVESHGGTITASGAPGKGMSFLVALPIARHAVIE